MLVYSKKYNTSLWLPLLLIFPFLCPLKIQGQQKSLPATSALTSQTDTLAGQVKGIIKGKVVDAATQQPLPYVNIGILNKNKGTVTNMAGEFELDLAKALPQDTLIVSMLGYSRGVFTVTSFKQYLNAHHNCITLNEQVEQLNEVVVRGKNLKTRTLGNNARSASVGITPFAQVELGNELGVYCTIKKNEIVYLQEFQAFIYLNDYDTAFFRLNIYALGEDNLPETNVLPEPVYVNFTQEKGMSVVDLRKYNISFTQDFVVTLEYIKEWTRVRTYAYRSATQPGIYFGHELLFGAQVIARPTSHAKWGKPLYVSGSPKMGIKVLYEKGRD